MLMRINSRLRLFWLLLTGSLAIASLVPGATLLDLHLSGFINRDWAHFLAYAAVSAIALLAWKLRTGMAISVWMAMLSFGLQVLRGLASGRGTDVEGAVINLLGIAAGILIGLHIHKFDLRTKQLAAGMAPFPQVATHPRSGESASVRDSVAGYEIPHTQQP